MAKKQIEKAKKRLITGWHGLVAFLVVVCLYVFYRALDVKVGGIFSTHTDAILWISGILLFLLIVGGAFSFTKAWSKLRKKYF